MTKNEAVGDAEAKQTIIPSYPPEQHWIRDLGIWVESNDDLFRSGLAVVPAVCTSEGSVRAGVIATLVDVVAGAKGAHAAAPDWIATCDLVLHLLRPTRGPELVATARLIRKGRSTLVLEVDVTDGAGGELAALSTVTFSILEARGAKQRFDRPSGLQRTEFELPGSGFSTDLPAALGACELDASQGKWVLELSPYNGNSLDALQGGALATLIELSCESLGRSVGGSSWVTTDYTIHYLSLGRPGPCEASARVLRHDGEHALLRIEVVDRGAEDRLVAVATATCEPLR